MTSKNQKDEMTQDELKRDNEMAEGKDPATVAKIYAKGSKYYCAECQAELPVHQSCPNCHSEIDWERVKLESRI